MPDTFLYKNLWKHACLQVGADGQDVARSIREKLQHFERISQVEMEEFVGFDAMEHGKGLGSEQVIDAGAKTTGTGVTIRKCLPVECFFGSVGLPVKTTFRVGFQLEKPDNFVNWCQG